MTRNEIKELDMKETFKKEFRERSALKRETGKQTSEQSVCSEFERLRIELGRIPTKSQTYGCLNTK